MDADEWRVWRIRYRAELFAHMGLQDEDPTDDIPWEWNQ
jgi:hypothetical protein